MPTIEIVCLGQMKPAGFKDLPFAVLSENKPISHRGLFETDFGLIKGCIYHLGNADLKGDSGGGFWASKLLSERCRAQNIFLEFGKEFVPFIQFLLWDLLDRSPEKRLFFATDYQFGPAGVRRYAPMPQEKFWNLHEKRKLRLNSLYVIRK